MKYCDHKNFCINGIDLDVLITFQCPLPVLATNHTANDLIYKCAIFSLRPRLPIQVRNFTLTKRQHTKYITLVTPRTPLASNNFLTVGLSSLVKRHTSVSLATLKECGSGLQMVGEEKEQ